MSEQTTVATQIVDKNGKFTTVHRRAVPASKAPKSIPAPGTRKDSGKPATRTPLPPVPQLSVDEARDVLKRKELYLSESRDLTREDDLLYWKNGVAIVSLIKDLLDNDRIEPIVIRRILLRAAANQHNENTYNALLISDYLKHARPPVEIGFDIRAMRSIEGLAPHEEAGQPMHRIATVEELRSYSAVVHFMVGIDGNSDMGKWVVIPNSDGTQTTALAVKNKHLENLIKERTDDTDAIIAYTMDRGMHPRNKRPVDALRAWLDETKDSRVISEGWL